MTYSPLGPQLLKGAIVAIDPDTARPSTILFQYNPEGVKRSLKPQVLGGEGGQQMQTLRYTGAPEETISVEITIHAADDLERGRPTTLVVGIHPELAALEVLTYPNSQQVIDNTRLTSQGAIEIGPYKAPLTLFVWGRNRVMPVLLTGLSVQEQLFDNMLNPIQATVSLEMRALSYSDLDPSHKGYHLFLAYQKEKETMSKIWISGTSDATGVTNF
jgi:hypothetical protein